MSLLWNTNSLQIPVQNPQELKAKAKVKLQFDTDFTRYLELDDYHDPICIVTESETIKCNAVLLAQHSDVLREYLKKDKELFLTDNKHVRECLSILYGGSVELTEENFQDILKFMVCFDITSVRDQVLDWMSQRKWNLDDAYLLINGSMIAVKSCSCNTDVESLRGKVYKPCRLFFEKGLVQLLDFKGTDERCKSLDTAMQYILSRVTDSKEFLAMLLHQDLIPKFIPWIQILIDQSRYDVFLEALQRPEFVNKMSLCTRAQFDGLFDKIEDFENMTLKEYKHLNKFKLKINEKMGICLSLKFMKENGNLHSCWKILDVDGLSVIPTTFSGTSDQFFVVENIAAWFFAKSCSDFEGEKVIKLIYNAIKQFSENTNNNSFQAYAKHVAEMLERFPNISTTVLVPYTTLGPTTASVSYRYHVSQVSVFQWILGDINRSAFVFEHVNHGVVPKDQIWLGGKVTVTVDKNINNSLVLQFTVKIFQNKVPETDYTVKANGSYHNSSFERNLRLFVYACELSYAMDIGGIGYCGRAPVSTHIPLYTNPAEAFETLKKYPFLRSTSNRFAQQYQQTPNEPAVQLGILYI